MTSRIPPMRRRREAFARKHNLLPRWDERPDDPENGARQQRAIDEMASFDLMPRFGRSAVIFPWNAAPPDPSKPDPRAAEEMRAFDRLSPEVRQRIANSPFGASVADAVAKVESRGCPKEVMERLKARNLTVFDVGGTEGVALELLAIAEETESKRLKAELDIP